MKKVSIASILFLFCFYVINAQIPFSLSNSVIFIPSGKSIITTGENYYINQLITHSNSVNIYYKASTLDFEELSSYGISVNYKLSELFQIYLGSGYFGFDLMNEFNVTPAITLNFDNLCIGLSGQYNRAFIKDFSSEGIFSLDLFGKVYKDDFSAGFLVNNINQTKYSNYENTINQRAIFSLGYEFNKQISADIGTIVIINSKSSLLFSLKYQLMEKMAFNLKYLTRNKKISFGVSLTPIKWIKLNFFFNHQEIFGADYHIINEINW